MKKGNIMRDVISSSQFTANVIKEYKKGLGKMSEADCVAELMRMYQKLTKEK